MKKRNVILSTFIISVLFAFFAFAGSVFASSYGGATVSWTAPITDEGGGELTGLTGYRVYYRNHTSPIDCTDWDAADQTDRQANTGGMLPTTPAYINVPSTNGTTTTYAFGGTTLLTPNTTYDFAVVAYDSDGNLSACATGDDGTTVDLLATYSADTDRNYNVNYLDYGTLHTNYGTTNSIADFDKDGSVGYLDYNILHNDYNKCFSTGCP